MPLGSDYARQDCGIARSLELVGERWTLLILRDAFFGVRRFSDFLTHLDISRGVLTARLDALVAEGLLRRVGDGHSEYELTDDALGLWPVLRSLAAWGDRRTGTGRPRRLFRHLDCGDLDRDGRCTTCGAMPTPADLEVRPGPGADLTVRDDPISQALRHPHRLLEPLRPGARQSTSS